MIASVPVNARNNDFNCLPHLPVVKDSISTPLRVVFNPLSPKVTIWLLGRDQANLDL